MGKTETQEKTLIDYLSGFAIANPDVFLEYYGSVGFPNPKEPNISFCNAKTIATLLRKQLFSIGWDIIIGLQITSGRKNFLYIFKNSKYFTLSTFAQAFSLFRRQFFLAAYAYEGNHSRTHSISHSLTFSRTPLLKFYKINYFQNKNNL